MAYLALGTASVFITEETTSIALTAKLISHNCSAIEIQQHIQSLDCIDN